MRFHEMHSKIQFIIYNKNVNILEELKLDPVEDKLAQYKQKWLNRDSRMEGIKYLKQLHDCWPTERRRPEPPLKRPLDG